MKKKNGFTLVELSIVLVIIGLLIGGVLVGQSLMSSAKIIRQVKQIQEFDIAVSNFQNNYNGLPGDIANAAFDSPGDGDGRVESSANFNPNYYYAHYSGEVRNFWYHLGSTGFGKNKGWDFSNPSECGNDMEPCDIIAPQLDMPTSELFPKTGIGVAYDSEFIARNKNGYAISTWTYGNVEE